MLARTAVVDDLESAAALIGERPELTAVSMAGDVFTAFTVTGGSAKAPSLLEVQAAVLVGDLQRVPHLVAQRRLRREQRGVTAGVAVVPMGGTGHRPTLAAA